MNPVRNKIPAASLLWPERISPEWMPFGHNGMKIRYIFLSALASAMIVSTFAPAQAIGVLVRMKSPPKDGGSSIAKWYLVSCLACC